MPITVKSPREIELMAEAGRILSQVHQELGKALHPGMSTLDIDRLGEEIIRGYGCIPSFLNYNGYPASICVSLNEEVVHGIPSADRIIKEGDIVSLDAGVIYKGYHSDAARTHAVGEVSKKAEDLIRVTRESFFEGIKYAKEGNHLFDISGAIGRYAEERGYGVVRDLCGHGIGTALHEAPEIPNYEMNRKGVLLKAGMTLAIEPMIDHSSLLTTDCRLCLKKLMSCGSNKSCNQDRQRRQYQHRQCDQCIQIQHNSKNRYNRDHTGKQLGKSHQQTVRKGIHIRYHTADQISGRMIIQKSKWQTVHFPADLITHISAHPVRNPVIKCRHNILRCCCDHSYHSKDEQIMIAVAMRRCSFCKGIDHISRKHRDQQTRRYAEQCTQQAAQHI